MARILRHMTYRARSLRFTSTPAEKLLWELLRNRRLKGAKFRRQHPLGQYIIDFYCCKARLAIECDGARHFPRPRRDIIRDAWLRQRGSTVLRFDNHRILKNTALVVRVISRYLNAHPRLLPPLPPPAEPAE